LSYPFKEIENKWRSEWDANKVYVTSDDRSRPKYYILDMFPYPSGQGLHVGHLKGYVATDVMARFKRMQGFSVLHPMGWDAFGLPAERQASRENIHPEKLVERNVGIFRKQLMDAGLSYDWTREIATTDKEYYKWTQWLFKRLYDKGLAYQADVPVNWCPALGTVLANEEVKDGHYVETGDAVERRVMKQWILRITAYADRLLSDLDLVDWPESVKEMQRQWIGRNEGTNIVFKVEGNKHSFDVFSTRADTLFGCTYCVLAPDHPIIKDIVSDAQREEATNYITAALNKSERERASDVDTKSGVFTGAMARNPVTGRLIPIYISDYVVAGVGTGAVFGCPAHDQRDFEFAKAFGLPIVQVVDGDNIEGRAYIGDGIHINSDFLNGLNTADAKTRINDWLEDKGVGHADVTYRLRDWLFSRQRYWGEPFPFIYTEKGEIKPVPDSALPVELPIMKDWENVRGEIAPLAGCKEWMQTVDPDTGRPALREVNTMPQWAGSSWYFLRFCDPHNAQEPWSKEAEQYWMPVDLYVGGVEHATLHLLYARFWHKVLFDLGLVSTPEPFKKLFNQGMITARSFRDARGKYYYPHEVQSQDKGWVTKEGNIPLSTQIEKMSKSRYNVVRPDDIIERFGADTLRTFEAFVGPVEKGGVWQDEHVIGVHRFLERVYQLCFDSDCSDQDDPKLERLVHKTIKESTTDLENLDLNTAVSKLMVLSTEFTKRQHTKESLKDFIRLLSPFAPFLAEECWTQLGEKQSITQATWPEFDSQKVQENSVTMAVQINGKVRGTLEVELDLKKEEVMPLVQKDPKLSRLLEQREVSRVIHVPNKVLNLIIK
jgi:leucyl-tRNA synthetase